MPNRWYVSVNSLLLSVYFIRVSHINVIQLHTIIGSHLFGLEDDEVVFVELYFGTHYAAVSGSRKENVLNMRSIKIF